MMIPHQLDGVIARYAATRAFVFQVLVKVTSYGKSRPIKQVLLSFMARHYEISRKRLSYITNRFW